jgi:hypothetical protein
LRQAVTGASTVFIAGLEPAGLLDNLGMVVHVDQTPIFRGVAVADKPFPADIIGGPIFKDFQNIDIRPAGQGYVLFAAKPTNAVSAILCYAAFAHIRGERFWLLGNYNLSFFTNAQAPWPADDWARGRTTVGAFRALVADVTSPGVYYLGDYRMDLVVLEDAGAVSGSDFKDMVLDSATLATGGSVRHKWKFNVAIANSIEGAKTYASALGLDAGKMQDLSGKWALMPKVDLEKAYLRKPGDPMPQTYEEFLKKMTGER